MGAIKLGTQRVFAYSLIDFGENIEDVLEVGALEIKVKLRNGEESTGYYPTIIVKYDDKKDLEQFLIEDVKGFIEVLDEKIEEK